MHTLWMFSKAAPLEKLHSSTLFFCRRSFLYVMTRRGKLLFRSDSQRCRPSRRAPIIETPATFQSVPDLTGSLQWEPADGVSGRDCVGFADAGEGGGSVDRDGKQKLTYSGTPSTNCRRQVQSRGNLFVFLHLNMKRQFFLVRMQDTWRFKRESVSRFVEIATSGFRDTWRRVTRFDLTWSWEAPASREIWPSTHLFRLHSSRSWRQEKAIGNWIGRWIL